MRKRGIFVVVLVTLMMVGGLILAGCSLGCVDRSTCTNYYSYDCGMSGCYSRTHYGYTCNC